MENELRKTCLGKTIDIIVILSAIVNAGLLVVVTISLLTTQKSCINAVISIDAGLLVSVLSILVTVLICWNISQVLDMKSYKSEFDKGLKEIKARQEQMESLYEIEAEKIRAKVFLVKGEIYAASLEKDDNIYFNEFTINILKGVVSYINLNVTEEEYIDQLQLLVGILKEHVDKIDNELREIIKMKIYSVGGKGESIKEFSEILEIINGSQPASAWSATP